MILQAISLSILASLLSIEWMNGHFGLSRPLITGMLTGLLLGDIQQGIIIGATLQLIFMGINGVGAAVPPDQTIGTLIATAFSILSGQGTELALTLAIPVAIASQALDIFGKTITTVLQHMADKFTDKRDYNKVSLSHYAGIIVTFLRVSIIVFPAIYFGVDVVTNLLDKVPPFILRGLEVSGGLLPAVGFGMLLTMLNIPYLFPFYLIGFALATFTGFSTVGVTLLAVCIAILIDYFRKNKVQESKDDLDALMED